MRLVFAHSFRDAYEKCCSVCGKERLSMQRENVLMDEEEFECSPDVYL